MTDTDNSTTGNEEPVSGTSDTGSVRGVVGERVSDVGLLDLRGVPPEDLARLKAVADVGLVLVDKGRSSALSHVRITDTGAVIEAEENERVLVGPTTEFSRAMVEAMEPGVRLTVIGMVIFDQDIPPALLLEKFASLRVIGVLIASAEMYGAMLGRLEHTGVAVRLKSGGPVLKNTGHTRITTGYLAHVTSGTLYLNLGTTEIDGQVTAAALAEKIGGYYNMGQTRGSDDVINWLRVNAAVQAGELKTWND